MNSKTTPEPDGLQPANIAQWELDAILLLSKDPMIGLGRLLRGSETLRDWAKTMALISVGEYVDLELSLLITRVSSALKAVIPIEHDDPLSARLNQALILVHRAEDDLVSFLTALECAKVGGNDAVVSREAYSEAKELVAKYNDSLRPALDFIDLIDPIAWEIGPT